MLMRALWACNGLRLSNVLCDDENMHVLVSFVVDLILLGHLHCKYLAAAPGNFCHAGCLVAQVDRGSKEGAPNGCVPMFSVEPDAEVESADHGKRLGSDAGCVSAALRDRCHGIRDVIGAQPNPGFQQIPVPNEITT